ncbi:MAG: hypothetical protein AB7N80_13380 [Bdellovibrionales bacterium]
MKNAKAINKGTRMMGMTRLVAVIALCSAAIAEARTDVKASMEQLKENTENSKNNYEQYKNNMEISSNNVVETTKAIKELRDQRKQLAANQTNIEKNKASIEKMKQKLAGHKVTELEKMKKEEAQIAEVRAVLEKLEANKRQREMNLTAYDTKIQELEKEKAEWDSQRQAAGELSRELDLKEKEVLAEREKWIEKKKGYRSEALKWHKQAQVAEQTETKFKRLQD